MLYAQALSCEMFLNKGWFIGFEKLILYGDLTVSDDNFKPLKTGTTIVGLRYKGGVILAADMRTTMGHHIHSGEARKIFFINDNLALSWAGSVSMNQQLVKYLRSELKIIKLRTNRDPLVIEAASMMRNWLYGSIRRPSMMQDISSFMFAGKDARGVHLHYCGADGTKMEIDKYIVDGSGMMYAYGVFESSFKENLEEKEAIDLAVRAVDAAMQRDVSSGNGVRVVVVNETGANEVLTKSINTRVQ